MIIKTDSLMTRWGNLFSRDGKRNLFLSRKEKTNKDFRIANIETSSVDFYKR